MIAPVLAVAPLSRRPAAGVAAAAAAVVAAVLLATSSALPMVWDEGDALARADGVLRWFHRWQPGAEGPSPLSRQAIAADWPFTTCREGHPPLYAIVIAAGRAASAGWLGPLTSYRLGPMLFFAAAAGIAAYRLARRRGTAAATVAVAALLLQPRLFAHAHFASFDGPLTSAWLLAWATYLPERRRRLYDAAWGAALGLTLSAKFTGWAAPVVFVLAAVFWRDRRAARTLALGLPVALATFFLLNPPLWVEPLGGLVRFFALNLHRGAQPDLNISTQFFGRLYNLDVPLPWYNTVVWTAIATPLGLLILGLAGAAAALCRRDRRASLVVGLWAVLLIARALPGTPVHDGIRLFLPSFAMLAVLAGVATSYALARWSRYGAAAVVVLLATSLPNLCLYAPQWLSFYGLAIGGLPGAARAGMEPTYYWDALDREALDWLHANTAAGEKIVFGSAPAENLRRLRTWGRLERDFEAAAPGRFVWYVVQSRSGGWQPEDRWLVDHARAAFEKRIGRGGFGPWRLDEPLLRVFAYAEYEVARRAVATAR